MEKPKLTAILVEDPIAVPGAIRSRRGLVDQRPTENGTILVFHENPHSSNLPARGPDRRKLFRSLKPESYEGRQVPQAEGDGQCQATTQSGSRCKKDAMEDSEFCSVHQE